MLRHLIMVTGFLSFVTFLPKQVMAQDKELDCLATAIYHEARGEPERGKIAVGNVILNRVQSRKFPHTVCGVVYQRSKSGCQFSWVCGGKKIPSGKAWADSQRIAKELLNEEHDDNTKGALYFYSSGRPSFSKRGVLVTIGNHNFVR